MLWKKRFVRFWIGVALAVAIVAFTSSFAYAATLQLFETENVIAEVTIPDEPMLEENVKLELIEFEVRTEDTDVLENETSSTEENEIIPEDVEEECLANLLSEAQTSATKAIEEDDPQAITFIEELEDGTRIYEFKDKTYTIPANLLQREPLVSESGYVEKITHVPLYLQQSYPYTDYGVHGTVSSHGCGIASCAMVYSYLLDREIRPDELAEQYGRYNTKHGSDYALFTKSAEDYGLEVTMTHRWYEVEEALRNGCIVIALVKSDTIFTNGGHYIVYYGLDENDRILINDPNIYNYGEWSHQALKTGFKEGFDMKYCQYSVPCWIFAPKDIEAIAARAEG